MGILEKGRKIVWFSVISPCCPSCKQELDINLVMSVDEYFDSWLQFYVLCMVCNYKGSLTIDAYNVDNKHTEVANPKDS